MSLKIVLISITIGALVTSLRVLAAYNEFEKIHDDSNRD